MFLDLHNLDPVIIHIYGPIALRWYGLAYALGIMIGLYNMYKIEKYKNFKFSKEVKESLLTYLVIGIILGGRIGYILFYNFVYYLKNPLDMIKIWEGGMSFHGGLLGVLIAGYVFSKENDIRPLEFYDLLSCSAPIGIFFGRIANFINSELYGRVTDNIFGVIFKGAGNFPRHPSQIYEALSEGLLVFLILNYRVRFTKDMKIEGKISGLFLTLYAIFRTICEFFREPDLQIGFFLNFLTIGQILSIPMAISGIYLLCRKQKI